MHRPEWVIAGPDGTVVRYLYTLFGQPTTISQSEICIQTSDVIGHATFEKDQRDEGLKSDAVHAAVRSQLRKSSLTPSHFIWPSASFVAARPIQAHPDSPSAHREWARIPASQPDFARLRRTSSRQAEGAWSLRLCLGTNAIQSSFRELEAACPSCLPRRRRAVLEADSATRQGGPPHPFFSRE